MTPAERLDQTLAVLQSIDRSLKILVQQKATSSVGAAPLVADDRDLDSQWGDPIVKVDPRDWSKGTMKGRKFSECPPEYLDLAAEMYEYFALKAEEKGETTDAGKPTAPYKRRDAARCRGWARRLRQQATGRTPKPNGTPVQGWSDDSEWGTPDTEPF